MSPPRAEASPTPGACPPEPRALVERRWGRVLASACGLLLCAWVLREDVQPDLYFHLAAGRWIWEQGLPRHNVFLWPSPEQPFVDHEWLFQALFWPLFRLGGAPLLTLIKSLCVLGTFGLMARLLRQEGDRLRWIVLSMALTVAGARFVLRPEVFSFFGVAAHLFFLSRGRVLERREGLALCGLQVVWVNVHGFSVLGPALVGCALGAGLIELALARRWPWLAPPPLRPLAALLGLELLASCLNPYGLEAAFYPFLILLRVSSDSAAAGLSLRVVELTSPFATTVRGVPEIRLYLAWLILGPLLWCLALVKRRTSLRVGALGALLVASSLLYLRNLPFAALGLCLPTAAGLGVIARGLAPRFGFRTRCLLAGVGTLLLLGLTRAVLSDDFHRNATYDARPGVGMGTFGAYPETVAFLESSPPAGKVFNNFGSGHYLIYAARGVLKPSICGNTDLYPRTHLRRYHALLRGDRPLSPELIASGVTDVVLDHRVEVEEDVLRGLIKDPEWGLVHLDQQAVVFRWGEAGLSAAEVEAAVLGWEFPEEEPDSFAPTRFLRWLGLLGPREVQPLGRLSAAMLLERVGRAAAAHRLIRVAGELAPDSLLVLYALAGIERARGQTKEARRLYLRVRELDPRAPLPLIKLGLLELKAGRPREAVTYLRAAWTLAPNYALARQNLLAALRARRDPVELRRVLAAMPPESEGGLPSARRAFYQGVAAHLEHDLERAEPALAEAVERDPKLAPALSLWAQVLGQLGRLPEAEAAWSALSEVSPRDASVWRALGRIRQVRGDAPGAIGAWEQAAKVNPRELKALIYAIRLLLRSKKHAQAQPLLQTLQERAPRDPRVIRLGNKLRRAKR